MKKYQPNWESLSAHSVPAWYDEAKVGIFIHWGPYSVPAFAPPVAELGSVPDDEWFVNNPYAEWYFNSVNVGRGPTWEHHLKTYGADFAYERFCDMWKAENWRPDEWADLFRRSGAGYVVLVTKHHDGFCLFPSRYTDYSAVNRGPRRDIAGELTRCVRGEGMKMGLYYSGLIDWTFAHEPMYNDYDVHHLNCPTYAYADYVYNQYLELIDRYHPSILWNDIGWPYAGERMLPYVLSYYYNACPDGVVNDRFNGLYNDYTTKEYHLGEMNREAKWESTRGLGLSFGYNAREDERHILSPLALVRELIKTVANNGNLLINVGPKADGTIPEIQQRSLLAMGKWLEVNGRAIYSTRVSRHESIETPDCLVQFTSRGNDLYAIVDAPRPCRVTLDGVRGDVSALGDVPHVQWRETPGGLEVVSGGESGFPFVLMVQNGEIPER
ncbi:MAG: alpha-L-fucosidase [Clostridia bacterium]|nr:alpha-L-fucosidase [Clostridia bacterium]